MRTPSRSRSVAGATAALLLLAFVPSLTGGPRRAEAATGLQLLAQAERNTNTVRTLSRYGSQTVTQPNSTITLTLRGTEDEVRNRETDSEAVRYSGKTSTGKPRVVRYTLNIVFMNGKTYFRTSLARNKWQTSRGMSVRDPYTGVGWRRARTTVPTIAALVKGITYRVVGTSGGLTHFRGSFKKPPIAGTDDLWVSGGARPYVVREIQRYHSTTKLRQNVVSIDNFGSFNAPVLITVPTKQAGA